MNVCFAEHATDQIRRRSFFVSHRLSRSLRPPIRGRDVVRTNVYCDKELRKHSASKEIEELEMIRDDGTLYLGIIFAHEVHETKTTVMFIVDLFRHSNEFQLTEHTKQFA